MSDWDIVNETVNILRQASSSCTDTDGEPLLTYSICVVKLKFLDSGRGEGKRKRRGKMRKKPCLLLFNKPKRLQEEWIYISAALSP